MGDNGRMTTARPRRRVRTEVPPGSDPAPQRFVPADGGPAEIRAEPARDDRRDDDESNDRDLRENVPPHNV